MRANGTPYEDEYAVDGNDRYPTLPPWKAAQDFDTTDGLWQAFEPNVTGAGTPFTLFFKKAIKLSDIKFSLVGANTAYNPQYISVEALYNSEWVVLVPKQGYEPTVDMRSVPHAPANAYRVLFSRDSGNDLNVTRIRPTILVDSVIETPTTEPVVEVKGQVLSNWNDIQALKAKTAELETSTEGSDAIINALEPRVAALEAEPDVDLTPYATSAYVDESIANLELVTPKGRVDTVDDLPTGATNGDLYYVGLETDAEFQQYVWFEGANAYQRLGQVDSNIVKLASDVEWEEGLVADKSPSVLQVTESLTELASQVSELETTPPTWSEDYTTKEYVDNLYTTLERSTLKGRVDTEADLPTENNTDGDIWFVGLETAEEFDQYMYFAETGAFQQLGRLAKTSVSLATDEEYSQGQVQDKAPSVRQVSADLMMSNPDAALEAVVLPVLDGSETAYVDEYAIYPANTSNSPYRTQAAALSEDFDSWTSGLYIPSSMGDPYLYFKTPSYINKIRIRNHGTYAPISVTVWVKYSNGSPYVKVVDAQKNSITGPYEVWEVDLSHVTDTVVSVYVDAHAATAVTYISRLQPVLTAYHMPSSRRVKEQVQINTEKLSSLKFNLATDEQFDEGTATDLAPSVKQVTDGLATAGRYPLNSLASGTTAATLVANTYTAIAGTVSTLSVTLPENTNAETTDIYMCSFRTGTTAPTLTFSDNVLVPVYFTADASTVYELTFVYGYANAKWLMIFNRWGE